MEKAYTISSCPIFAFLILIIGISVFSFAVLLLLVSSITMANAQVSSGGDNNHRNDSGTKMGVCVLGMRSPCNGD